MRVCLVSRELAPYWGGGIGTYAAQMAAAWAGAGHETHVLTLPHEGLAERSPAGVRFHAMRVPQVSGPGRFAFQRHGAAVLEWLERLHGIAPFDAVEFPDYWAEGAAAIAGARLGRALEGAVLVVRLHTPTHEARMFNAEATAGEELDALECAEDEAIRAADLVASPTRALLDLVSRRLRLGAASAQAVVPYPFDGADLAELGAGTAATGEDVATPGRPTVLYFGRLERRKGVEILVAAGQRLLDEGAPVQIRFIGGDTRTGPGASSMVAYLRSLTSPRWSECFRFDGPRPRSALAEAVRAACAAGGGCCFPSLWENFPNTCVEAMALGAPVIGSDAGGMAEIIQDGVSGLLFRSGDAGALAAAIGRLLNDAALRARLGAAGPGRIRALCDPPRVVAQMAAAIQSARARHGSGASAGVVP